MTSISIVCKQLVLNSIDPEYLAECGDIKEIYHSEYGSWNGTTPKACMDYLQCLPSVCTVPFYNGRILDTLEKAGIDIPQDDDGQYDLIEAYWLECGKQFYLMVK